MVIHESEFIVGYPRQFIYTEMSLIEIIKKKKFMLYWVWHERIFIYLLYK